MGEEQRDLEAMREDLAEKAREVAARVADFARERPHAAVAIAFGVGWVLGNGLPPRVLLGVARLGLKAALGGLLASGGLAELLVGEEGEARPPGAAIRSSGPRIGRAGSEGSAAGTRGAPPSAR